MLLTAALFLFLGAAALAEETPPATERSDDRVTAEAAQQTAKPFQAEMRQAAAEESHRWSVTRQEPTCEEDGKELKECVLCGATVETVLPAAGHSWSDWREDAVDPKLACVTDVVARRTCSVCGKEETKIVSAAPGHQWTEAISRPATCTEPESVSRSCARCGLEENITVGNSPALGHLFADASVLAGHAAGNVISTGEWTGSVLGTVAAPATCTENGSGTLLCVRCQQASRSVTIPSTGHDWTAWETVSVPQDQICVTEAASARTCRVCGETETRVDGPAPGHRWATVSYTMPTCTEPGVAYCHCSVCGTDSTVESPALGHSYVWVQVTPPSPTSSGLSEYTCVLCGDVAEQRKVPYTQMMYNNTVTSFGPTTRDLIGGSVWNRVTPLDLSEDGVYTYPLVASNRYTIGTATVEVDHGIQTVSYHLNSSSILVHSESLVIYPNAEALRTGENAASFAFDDPIDIAEYFGSDERVIMAISLKADFNAVGLGVQSFVPDQEQIETMIDLLD